MSWESQSDMGSMGVGETSARDHPPGRIPLDAVTLILGLIALAGLLGFLKALPAALAFFAGSISIILFPGMALHRLAGCRSEEWLFPEQVTIWFVGGLAGLSVLSFLGIALSLRLSTLSWIVASCYLILLVGIFVSAARRSRSGASTKRDRFPRPGLWAIILITLSVALAFTTLYTARDSDDWFYLAYIGDYLEDLPINSRDAMLGPGWEAPARTWYGSWWVTEALLARATGGDPIRCHQTYLCFLVLPVAVLALFSLARRVFQDEKAAYLACFLHMIFYLSSAYPTDSAGWGLLSRITQDKVFAFFVPATAALAFGLGLLVPAGGQRPGGRRDAYFVYVAAVAAAALVHPLGLVWCAVGLVPIAVVEFLRKRDRMSGRKLVLILIPLVLFGAILSSASQEAAGILEERSSASRMEKREQPLWDFYLPGERFSLSAGDRTYEISNGSIIAHPLLVSRFPLAIVGLVLTFVIGRRVRSSFAARYLVVLTAGVMALAFVPGLAGSTARLINERMLYRLAWLLPWGFTIALFLLQLRLRQRWAWLVVVVLTLALARGVPQNYFQRLVVGGLQGRVGPELEEAFRALRSEPSPRGIVLASPGVSLMLPASVREAYPAYVNPAYTTGGEGERIRSAMKLTRLLATGRLDEVLPTLGQLNCRYALIERSRSLALALGLHDSGFLEIFTNRTYALYRRIDSEDGGGDGPITD